MTHTIIYIGYLNIIDSANGLTPDRRQAITWANAGMLLIGTLGTKSSEILIQIRKFSLKMCLKESSAKWQPVCIGLNVLMSEVCCISAINTKPKSLK